MFENPYAFLRWGVILIAVALLIYKFQLLKEFLDILTRKKSKQDENVPRKIDELLNRMRRRDEKKNKAGSS
ncbi:MAG: hypothetical protein AB1394_00075 [Bacteroidota bacterium]